MDVTRFLAGLHRADDPSFRRVVAALYDELRALAHSQLGRTPEAPLRTTGLVHEAWLRLAEQQTRFASRAHFFSVAATLMRRIVLDHVRAERAQRRGGDVTHVELIDAEARGPSQWDVLALDAALEKLRALDVLQADLIELRVFAGLSLEECAAGLDLSVASLKREWAMARAFLIRELADE